MNRPNARAIHTPTYGRYLADDPSGPSPTLVGFHGYAEAAETQWDRLQAIPDRERWRLISIQGLHRFYRGRSEDVVASWMTRQDRELALADNASYVAAVLDEVAASGPRGAETLPLVFAGFSQGVAMAFRAACFLRARHEPSATRAISVIALGGDVPPEIDLVALASIAGVLLGRGLRDEWYTEKKWRSDEARLREAGVEVEALELDAGHEWTTAFNAAAGAFLARRWTAGSAA